MNNRIYNKLFVPTNRNYGNEKLIFGYQSKSTEIVLKKDRETYFHIPAYSSAVSLSSSGLIENGALGGPFPAASDRIFQSRKNYGDTTNNGALTSSLVNGKWFCSWLYQKPDGSLQWYDRYFNPGSVNVINLLQYTYTPNNPVFQDVPSALILEPNLLYKYFHAGEQSAATIVNSFSGNQEQTYELFNLSNWNPVSSIDISSNNIKVIVNSPATNLQLYSPLEDPQRVTSSLLSFNHNKNVESYILWDEKLDFSNEFTLSLWARSDDWSSSPTTQLAGNYTSNGGVGLFIDDLRSYPIFVIPETYYGHVLVVNENGVGVNDSLTRFAELTANEAPKFVCVDSDFNIIICHNDNTGTAYKIDHFGTMLKMSTTNFSAATNEVPVKLVCGLDNDIFIITTHRIYHFDTNFVLKNATNRSTPPTTVIAISSIANTGTYGFAFDTNSTDVKFDQQTKWSLGKNDYNLYKNGNIFHTFSNKPLALQIDPNSRIWVLHGNNDVTVLNTSFANETEKIAFRIDIGLNVSRTSQRYISFINHYDRSLQTHEWLALIQYDDETVLYMVDMTGQVKKTINVNTLYRNQILKELGQDPARFRYQGVGDFTGYEHRRVFYNLTPYSKNRRLILKASLRDFDNTASDYSIFQCGCTIDGWDDKSWQNVAVTYRNNQFKLYVNGILKNSLTHQSRYGLSLEQQQSWFFGSPAGYKNGINKEIGSTSLLFNGYLQGIKLYKRCLKQEEIVMFVRESIVAEDIYWTLQTPIVQYVEKIDRVFKHKLPGSKSIFYKVKLANLGIEDPFIQNLIKEEITRLVENLNPGYVDFVDIEWL